MKVKEEEVPLSVDISIWVQCCCADCGEDLDFKTHSDSDGGITVEVEPNHQCKEVS